MKWLFGTEDGYVQPLWNRMKWRAVNSVSRMRRRLWPANSSCDACGYRCRRTRRGKWCPACWDDLGGELIRDRTSPISETGDDRG